jgi:hypothetical protein
VTWHDFTAPGPATHLLQLLRQRLDLRLRLVQATLQQPGALSLPQQHLQQVGTACAAPVQSWGRPACVRLTLSWTCHGVNTHCRPSATAGASTACQPCSVPWCWRAPPPAFRAPASRTRGWRPACGRMHRLGSRHLLHQLLQIGAPSELPVISPFVAAHGVSCVHRKLRCLIERGHPDTA